MLLDPTDRLLFRRIWSLTWPMVLYNVLEMSVGLADLLMVRPLGPAATAAIGVSRQLTFLLEAAAVAISSGVITLVSQGVGARRTDQVASVVRQSAWLVLLLGLPTTVVGYLLSQPLLVSVNANAQTLVHGVPYLHVYFAGTVLLWGNIVAAAIFRGAGDVWTPLKMAVGVNVLNVLLNYLFIFGLGPVPAFEVQGAAMGTVAARAGGLAAYLFVLWRRRSHFREKQGNADAEASPGAHRRIDWALIGRMLRIGAPMALAAVLRNGSRVIFVAIVGASALGMSFHAAVGVGLQVRLLSVLPALAFQAATATLVGQAIGRGDYGEAQALGRRSVQLLAVLMFLVVALIMALADPLAALFIGTPQNALLGAKVLRWFAAAQFFSALSIATQGALLGAGDTAPAMRYTLVSQWAVMLPLAQVLLWAGWTPEGPLAAWLLAPIISLLLTKRRFESGRWKRTAASA